MFCQNLDTLNAVREYGERDALTGLYNRNKYEEDLPKVQGCYEHSLACVYIDVNGLHELNNTKGHEAGDMMLKTVSRKIRDRFGEEYAYRIGGDEFVVFVPDQPEEVSGRLAEELIGFLKEDGYYISVGIAWEENGAVDGLIKTAERKMYIEKKKFYEQAVNDRRGKSRL
nr:GGDEF domain-containing protein [Faecalicatena fissicatena]